MQITGGKFKGQRLITPPLKYLEIRPLRSRIRKALFDILGNHLENFEILDLFAGTGALGIEALSRGAEYVLFVDLNPLSLEIIRKNLKKFGLEGKAEVIRANLPQDLTKILRLCLSSSRRFKLVFITPPYRKGLALKTLEKLPISLLEKEAIIVVEEKREVVFPEKIANFYLDESRFYGETALHFYIFKDSNP
ncbi:MAG: 16S rRNA (guanine(966)-N(2))-methyltransferase RsmD [Caldimicrobium sp.]